MGRGRGRARAGMFVGMGMGMGMQMPRVRSRDDAGLSLGTASPVTTGWAGARGQAAAAVRHRAHGRVHVGVRVRACPMADSGVVAGGAGSRRRRVDRVDRAGRVDRVGPWHPMDLVGRADRGVAHSAPMAAGAAVEARHSKVGHRIQVQVLVQVLDLDLAGVDPRTMRAAAVPVVMSAAVGGVSAHVAARSVGASASASAIAQRVV